MNELERIKEIYAIMSKGIVSVEDVKAFIISVSKAIDSTKTQLTRDYSEQVNKALDSISKVNEEHLTKIEKKTSTVSLELNTAMGELQDLIAEFRNVKPRDGIDGKDGRDGIDGRNGKDGKDGSPDTGHQIVDKINSLPVDNDDDKIDASHIKNLPEFIGKEVRISGSRLLDGLQDVNLSGLTRDAFGRWILGSGNGTVSSFAFTDGNGFDGTVTNSTTTPTLSLTTTLTQGSIVFIGAGGALNQDNTNLFFDNTNNRLGLGTNTPTQTIDMLGSIHMLGTGLAGEAYIRGDMDDAGNQFIVTKGVADAFDRFELQGDGQMAWGSGASGYDTALYRYSALTLAVSNHFVSDTDNTYDLGATALKWKKGWFTDLNVNALTASRGVYTDASKNLTSTPPTSGVIGYWTRSGTILSPATAGDTVTVIRTGSGLAVSNLSVVQGRNNATYNTTGGVIANFSGYFQSDATRSAGSNALRNYALYLASTGGQENYGWVVGSGKNGIETLTPTAYLHIAHASSGAVGEASFKMNAGTLLAVTEAGAMETNGIHLYFTFADGGTRYQLDQQGTSGITNGSGTTVSGTAIDWRGTLTTASNIDQDANDILWLDNNNYANGFFGVSTATNIAFIGDYNGDVGGTYLYIDDSSQILTLASADTQIFNPHFIVGSDATNDMYYRSSSGIAGRIPIGSAGTVLGFSGGTIQWLAPSVRLDQIIGATSSNTSSTNGNTAITFNWGGLTTATGFSITSNGTGANSNTQTAFAVGTSGANANSTQTTYAQKITNTHTGTSSTNVGLYISATGGTTNYGLLVENGSVGIGTTTPSSKLDITTASLGTTQTATSGIALVNTTLATAGNQQISGAIRWSGQGWKTNATASSQPVDFRAYVVPVQGVNTPEGNWILQAQTNNGGYTTRFGVGFNGEIYLSGTNAGTAGQILTSGGAGASASWGTAFGLTNGSGTTANGTQVDLLGTLQADANVNGGGSYNFLFSSSASGFSTDFSNRITNLGDVTLTNNLNVLTIDDTNNIGYYTNHNSTVKFGINTTTPDSTLKVVGSLSLPFIAIATEEYTALESDYTIAIDNGASNYQVHLPDPALTTGRIYIIKRLDNTSTGNIVIDCPPASFANPVQNALDGTQGTSYTISSAWGDREAFVTVMYQSDGVKWQVIGR